MHSSIFGLAHDSASHINTIWSLGLSGSMKVGNNESFKARSRRTTNNKYNEPGPTAKPDTPSTSQLPALLSAITTLSTIVQVLCNPKFGGADACIRGLDLDEKQQGQTACMLGYGLDGLRIERAIGSLDLKECVSAGCACSKWVPVNAPSP